MVVNTEWGALDNGVSLAESCWMVTFCRTVFWLRGTWTSPGVDFSPPLRTIPAKGLARVSVRQ
jgi:hypothetical protein